jgi:hypothetical protein
LQYILINDLGAFVLGHHDEYEARKSDNDIFTFDGTDMVASDTAAIPPGLELYLEKIGERTEVDRWRLTISSLLTALTVARVYLKSERLLKLYRQKTSVEN